MSNAASPPIIGGAGEDLGLPANTPETIAVKDMGMSMKIISAAASMKIFNPMSWQRRGKNRNREYAMMDAAMSLSLNSSSNRNMRYLILILFRRTLKLVDQKT